MNTITCVYCGMAYPEGTPTHGAQILTDHILVCEKHPVSKLRRDNEKLRNAVIRFVGAESIDELNAMEKFLGELADCEQKTTALIAIKALKETA